MFGAVPLISPRGSNIEGLNFALKRTFDLIANFPRIGQAVDEIAPGFRRFRFQAHTVFYTEESGFILIRAVLHQAREVKPDLFD